jgi:hypothetical protein
VTVSPKQAKPEKVKKLGRPSLWSEAVGAEIVRRLSEGETLASICRDDKMPEVRTVSDWKRDHEGFSASFAHARDVGFDKIAADCLDIADDGSNDYVTKTRPDGSEYEAVDAEHIQRSKLRIETRLKLLAKWDPKRYGERLELAGKVQSEHTMSKEMQAWLDQRSN